MKPKQRILETSTELFHQNGYNSTGINEIIEKSNVAKSTFYQHFKSKEGLAIEYLKKRHRYWFEALKEFTKNETTFLEKILSSFDFISSMNEKENYRGCAFLNMLSEIDTENEKIYAIIQEHKSDLQNYFYNILKDEEKSFITYMLFEACIIESQVYRKQHYIEKNKKIVTKLI